MIRILEIAWLVITVITFIVAAVQLVQEGPQSALFMFIVSIFAGIMYLVRRKQRIQISQQQQQTQDDATRYH